MTIFKEKLKTLTPENMRSLLLALEKTNPTLAQTVDKINILPIKGGESYYTSDCAYLEVMFTISNLKMSENGSRTGYVIFNTRLDFYDKGRGPFALTERQFRSVVDRGGIRELLRQADFKI